MLALASASISYAPVAPVARANVAMQASQFNVRAMPGITDPLGFFDPLGFTEGASEGKIKFYREVEIKHGRVAMLACLGFVVAESACFALALERV